MKVTLVFFAGLFLTLLLPATAQDMTSEIDLLYPEYASPVVDAKRAIARGDFRFIAVDRTRRVVPGTERATRLRRIYKTKFLRQRLRLFPSASANFSFNLRAHAYAREYNLYVVRYLRQTKR